MTTLDSPAVSARLTEQRVQELFNELYKAFFTGSPHVSPTNGAEVTFPVCDLFFNQAELPRTAVNPQIHTVFTDLRPIEESYDAELKIVTVEGTFMIFTRVANNGAQGNQSDFLCRSVADNLKEIFQVEDRYALAQKGIRHPRILRGPNPMATVGWQVRLLVLRCQPRFKMPR